MLRSRVRLNAAKHWNSTTQRLPWTHFKPWAQGVRSSYAGNHYQEGPVENGRVPLDPHSARVLDARLRYNRRTSWLYDHFEDDVFYGDTDSKDALRSVLSQAAKDMGAGMTNRVTMIVKTNQDTPTSTIKEHFKRWKPYVSKTYWLDETVEFYVTFKDATAADQAMKFTGVGREMLKQKESGIFINMLNLNK